MPQVLIHPAYRKAKAPDMQKIIIPPFKVGISTCRMTELLKYVEEAIQHQQRVLIDNVNMDILWNAHQNPEYCDALNQLANITLVDGMPLCWLAKLAGVEIPERLALTDVVPQIMSLATQKDFSVFIVGSNPKTLATAKKTLRLQNKLPSTVSCWSEPRKKLENSRYNRMVLEIIRETQPDIILVALGSPWQTLWIKRNWNAFPNSVIIPVGGAFDYIAGSVGRAPVWMQKTGLEWVYRLLFDYQKRDRSLFKRYILDDLPFALRLAIDIQFKGQRVKPIPSMRHELEL